MFPSESKTPPWPGLLAASALLACACSSMRVPVSPPDLSALPAFRASQEGLEIGIHPLDTAEGYWDMFGEDLPALGIVAAWVEMHNAGGAAADFRATEWEIRTASQGPLRRIQGGKVLKRYYKGKRTRAYSLRAHEQALEALDRISFGSASVAPFGKLQGLMFFESGRPVLPGWSREARILVRKLQLGQKRLTFEVPFHALSP